MSSVPIRTVYNSVAEDVNTMYSVMVRLKDNMELVRNLMIELHDYKSIVENTTNENKKLKKMANEQYNDIEIKDEENKKLKNEIKKLKNEIKKLKNEEIEENEEEIELDKCPICIGDIEDKKTTVCNHDFCKICITEWEKTGVNGKKCPVCRQKLAFKNTNVNNVPTSKCLCGGSLSNRYHKFTKKHRSWSYRTQYGRDIVNYMNNEFDSEGFNDRITDPDYLFDLNQVNVTVVDNDVECYVIDEYTKKYSMMLSDNRANTKMNIETFIRVLFRGAFTICRSAIDNSIFITPR